MLRVVDWGAVCATQASSMRALSQSMGKQRHHTSRLPNARADVETAGVAEGPGGPQAPAALPGSHHPMSSPNANGAHTPHFRSGMQSPFEADGPRCTFSAFAGVKQLLMSAG